MWVLACLVPRAPCLGRQMWVVCFSVEDVTAEQEQTNKQTKTKQNKTKKASGPPMCSFVLCTTDGLAEAGLHHNLQIATSRRARTNEGAHTREQVVNLLSY